MFLHCSRVCRICKPLPSTFQGSLFLCGTMNPNRYIERMAEVKKKCMKEEESVFPGAG